MTDFNRIKKWYSGKTLERIEQFALPILERAEEQDQWPPKASRSVKAALNKQNVANKFARANDRLQRVTSDRGLLIDIRADRSQYGLVAAWHLVHAMEFGLFMNAPKCLELARGLVDFTITPSEVEALKRAHEWAEDFAPIAELVKRLDATRPKPVYVFKTLSVGVLSNVGLAMGIKLESIEMPRIEWVRTEDKHDDGLPIFTWTAIVHWPENTQHETSRFANGSVAGNQQCHACGHAIKDGTNWVPLVGRSTGGKPLSLWVGRDCARNLFGCETSGEGDYSAAIRMNRK